MQRFNLRCRGDRQTKMSLRSWGIGLLLAATSFACSGGASDDDLLDDSPEPPAAQLVSERLAELDLGDQRLTFDWIRNDIADDGTPRELEGAAAGYISISYGSDGPDVLAALYREHGALTSLEIFTAFAPPGAEPHPLLVEAHDGEARALARTDVVPRVLSAAPKGFDYDIPSDCYSTVYPNISPVIWAQQQELKVQINNTNYFLCAGTPKVSGIGNPTGCVRHDSRKIVMVGVCNSRWNPNATSWTYFLNGVQPMSPPPAAGAFGGIQKVLFNPQPLPPGGGVVPTRSLASRASNSNDPETTHFQESGVSGPP